MTQDPNATDQIIDETETEVTAATVEAEAEPIAEATAPEGEPEIVEEDAADPLAEAQQALAERTEDLQRLQAEYVNYKRRVDRDRDLARAAGIEKVVMDLIPVLDNLRTAREHKELTGGFKLLADEVEKIAAKHGLVAYTEKGDVFDPQIHDALMQVPTPDITEAQCHEVIQIGYRLNDKVVRPARVAVAVPAEDA